jgi:hypothetical protein
MVKNIDLKIGVVLVFGILEDYMQGFLPRSVHK